MKISITTESKSRLKEDTTLVKINVTTATKLFNNGETIYLLPNKVRLDNPWIKPFPINISTSQGKSLETILASYSYYNCNNETGKTIAYYREG